MALAGAVYFGTVGVQPGQAVAQTAVTGGLWVPIAAYVVAAAAALALPRLVRQRVVLAA